MKVGLHQIIAEGRDGYVERVYVRDRAILKRKLNGVRLIDLLGAVEVIVATTVNEAPGWDRQVYSSKLKPVAAVTASQSHN